MFETVSSPPRGLDFVGDIHGQLEKLLKLLTALGYQSSAAGFQHPEGRAVVFLGDYVDRGPQVREVLQTVRAMVENKQALALAGNHEYNQICYHTPDGAGGWLRKHSERNTRQITATLQAFEGREEEWRDWLKWFSTLPCYLDLTQCRAVHACWDSRQIPLLPPGILSDAAFLKASATRGTPEFQAVETVLKGVELRLPEGITFRDKEGVERTRTRIRWWRLSGRLTLGDIVMPPGSMRDSTLVDAGALLPLPHYPADAPPVFFGHYWLAPDAPKAPLAPNLACLDYSAGLGGNLVAYRWDGEATLQAEKFVAVT